MEEFLSIEYKYDRGIEFRSCEALWKDAREPYLKRYYGGIVAGVVGILYGLFQKKESYGTEIQSNYSYVILGCFILSISIWKLLSYRNQKQDFFLEHRNSARQLEGSKSDIQVQLSSEGLLYRDAFASVTADWDEFLSFYYYDGFIFLVKTNDERLIFSEEYFGSKSFISACEIFKKNIKGDKSNYRRKQRKKREDIIDD